MGPGPETVLILLIVHLTGKLDFALQFATLGNAVTGIVAATIIEEFRRGDGEANYWRWRARGGRGARILRVSAERLTALLQGEGTAEGRRHVSGDELHGILSKLALLHWLCWIAEDKSAAAATAGEPQPRRIAASPPDDDSCKLRRGSLLRDERPATAPDSAAEEAEAAEADALLACTDLLRTLLPIFGCPFRLAASLNLVLPPAALGRACQLAFPSDSGPAEVTPNPACRSEPERSQEAQANSPKRQLALLMDDSVPMSISRGTDTPRRTRTALRRRSSGSGSGRKVSSTSSTSSPRASDANNAAGLAEAVMMAVDEAASGDSINDEVMSEAAPLLVTVACHQLELLQIHDSAREQQAHEAREHEQQHAAWLREQQRRAAWQEEQAREQQRVEVEQLRALQEQHAREARAREQQHAAWQRAQQHAAQQHAAQQHAVQQLAAQQHAAQQQEQQQRAWQERQASDRQQARERARQQRLERRERRQQQQLEQDGAGEQPEAEENAELRQLEELMREELRQPRRQHAEKESPARAAQPPPPQELPAPPPLVLPPPQQPVQPPQPQPPQPQPVQPQPPQLQRPQPQPEQPQPAQPQPSQPQPAQPQPQAPRLRPPPLALPRNCATAEPLPPPPRVAGKRRAEGQLQGSTRG